MWTKSLFLISLLLSSHVLMATDYRGTVHNKTTGEPVVGAVLLLKDEDGSILSYVSTSADGSFSFSDVKTAASLEIRAMGYSTLVVSSIPDDTLNILLEENNEVLKESFIKAEKVTVRGDTISYNIPAIVTSTDRSLQDVLRRIPGINLTEKGYIQYNGQSINRFYVDGHDIFDSKYNIAVQNLTPEVLSTLQIFENHQPIKALEDLVRSDNAAINIVLKPSVKSKWIYSAGAEAGYHKDDRFPLSAEAFGMLVKHSFQSMNTAKYDYSGKDIIRDAEVSNPGVIILSGNDYDFGWRYNLERYISGNSMAPFFAPDRSRFNESYSLSTFNKVVLPSNQSLAISVDMEGGLFKKKDSMRRTTFDEDGTILSDIEDSNAGVQKVLQPSLELKYVLNDARTYINEHLKVRRGTSEYRDDISGEQPLEKSSEEKNFEILNYFSFLRRRNESSALSFSIMSQYTDRDENLSVLASDSRYLQKVHSSFARNNASMSFSKSISGHLRFLSDDNIVFQFLKMSSGLDVPHKVLDPGRGSNDAGLFSLMPNARQTLRYQNNRVIMDFITDISYQLLYRKDSHLDDMIWHSFLGFSPAFRFEYRATPKSTLRLSYVNSLKPINLENMHRGVIMRSHMYYAAGSEWMKVSSNRFNFKWDYHNPLTGIYLVPSVSYDFGKTTLTDRTLLDDGNSILERPSVERAPFVSEEIGLRFEKGFMEKAGKLVIDVSASNYRSSIRQSDSDYPYLSRTISANGFFNLELFPWLAVDYEGSGRYGRFRIDDAWSSEGYYSWTNSMKITFLANLPVHFETVLDNYGNKKGGAVESINFWDFSVIYQKSRLLFSLNLKNVLNVDSYDYMVESPLQTISYSTRLRPFSVTVGFSLNL